MTVSAKEYKKILDVLESMYSAGERAPMFRRVCKGLQDLVPFTSAVLIPTDPATGHFLMRDHARFRAPAGSVLAFCLYYAQLQPLVAGGLLQYVNQAVRITDVLPAVRLAQTEYCRNFQARYNIFYELCVPVRSTSGALDWINLHRSRSERNFTSREQEMISLLIPHFSRALCLSDGRPGGAPDNRDSRARLGCPELSPRQREIAFLVTQGLSNREIAERLFIAEQTVKDHLSDIFGQMNVHRRGELTAKLLGLCSPAGVVKKLTVLRQKKR